MLLFDEDEKKRVKGFVINKFRGEVKLLESGLEMLEEITNVPTLGVVPYINVDIEEEDVLSESISGKKTPVINLNETDLKKYKQTQYDILADSVRNSLDIQAIYKIMG